MKTKTQNIIQKCFLAVTLVIAGLVLITATSKAQTAPSPAPLPESLPIGSQGMIRAYALEQVAGARLTIFGEAIMWNSNSVTEVYFHPKGGTTVDAALSAMNANSFKFKVSDKTKPLGVWAELHNADGMALFYGYTEVAIGEKGNLIYNTVNLKMNPYVPIYVGPGVESATIKTSGSWQDVSAWNGYIFFPTKSTGNDGTLSIRQTNGYESQEIGYSLKNSGKIPLWNITGSVGVRLDDFQSFNDTGMASGAIMYIGAVGYFGDGHEAPVVSFKLTSTRPVCFFSGIYTTVDYSLIESPTVGWYFKKGDTTENPVNLTPKNWSTPITLPAGEYFFYPETGLYQSSEPVIVGEKG